jgi:TatD DNase family protein
MLIDTHCHIHESDYPIDGDEVIAHARDAGVMEMVCIGSNTQTSREAVDFAKNRDGIYATVGVHPHFAKDGLTDFYQFFDGAKKYIELETAKIIAIGEVGLDYFYNNSSKADQIKVLEEQIDIAMKNDLPIVFHVREAYDNFHGIRGVLHSFTDDVSHMENGLSRGLYFGVNGIATFTKKDAQVNMFNAIPLDKVLLETDAPFLTPNPLRGKIKINEPAFVREIAEFVSSSRNISLEDLAKTTTANAKALFNL